MRADFYAYLLTLPPATGPGDVVGAGLIALWGLPKPDQIALLRRAGRYQYELAPAWKRSAKPGAPTLRPAGRPPMTQESRLKKPAAG